ncbi:MAG TPA: M56 family metallopeptidase [Anaerohalosphaeraceae bacterium]|nr:M56 family metallopeptidase [Anaerohalosphaeraceae bacterium]
MIEAINDVAAGWFAWQAAMLWQVAVLIGIVAGADWAMRRWAWPQVRYALWLLVFVKLVVPPTAALSTSLTGRLAGMVEARVRVEVVDRQEADGAATDAALVTDAVGEDAGGEVPAPVMARETAGRGTMRLEVLRPAEVIAVPGTAPEAAVAVPVETAGACVPEAGVESCVAGARLSWKVYLMGVWLAGAGVLTLWLVLRLRGFRREHLRGDVALPEGFEELMAGTARQLRLRRRVRVVLTDRVSGPAVFGVFRPVLLMPAERVGELTREELEHVFLHELAHVKRGDLLVHGVGMVLQIAYWFNPLLWVIRRPMQELRELCCDATVARVLRERTGGYRETLLETARRLVAEPAGPGMGLLGLFENSNRLLDRLKWLDRQSWRRRWLRLAAVCVLVAVMLACVLPMAQIRGAGDVGFEAAASEAPAGQAPVGSRAEVNDPKYVSRISYERPASDLAADGFKDEEVLFGDTVGFAVNWHNDGVVHTIDFDTARIIQMPEDVDVWDKEAIRLWAESEGVDAVIGSNRLTTVHMAAVGIHNEGWTRLYPGTLESLNGLTLDSGKALGAISGGFAYHAFKTSCGRLGIVGLSVQWGSGKTPHRLIIKYKLAKREGSALRGGSSKTEMEMEGSQDDGVVEGAAVGKLGDEAKSTSAEAAFIIQKVLDRYAAIKTYSAVGELLTDVNSPGEAMPAFLANRWRQQTLKSIFTIKMGRPNLYCIEWNENVGTAISKAGNVWSVGDGSQGLILGMEKSFEQPLRALIATASNMGRIQFSIFFDTSLNELRQLRDLSQRQDEQLEGLDCYVISGRLFNVDHTFWISKKDFLIRRQKSVSGGDGRPVEQGKKVSDEEIKEVLSASDAEGTPEEIAKLRAVLAHARETAAKVKVTRTETYRNIVLDEPISREEFVPGGDAKRLESVQRQYNNRLRSGSAKEPDAETAGAVFGRAGFDETIGRRPHPFSAVVGGGTRVELLGLCEIPAEGKAWWAADGGPVTDVYWDGAHAREGEGARQAVFRIHSDEADPDLKPTVNLSVRRNSVAEGSWAGGFIVSRDNKTLEDLRGCCFSLPDDHLTVDIEATVGYGPWRTNGTRMADMGGMTGPMLTNVGTLIFHDPTVEDGKTILSATLLNQVKVWRLAAIDRQGKLCESSSATSMGTKEADGSEYTILRAEFARALSAIDRFEFQTRPFEIVTFRNVSLYPGAKTDAEVVIGDAVDEAEVADLIARWRRAVLGADREALGELMVFEDDAARERYLEDVKSFMLPVREDRAVHVVKMNAIEPETFKVVALVPAGTGYVCQNVTIGRRGARLVIADDPETRLRIRDAAVWKSTDKGELSRLVSCYKEWQEAAVEAHGYAGENGLSLIDARSVDQRRALLERVRMMADAEVLAMVLEEFEGEQPGGRAANIIARIAASEAGIRDVEAHVQWYEVTPYKPFGEYDWGAAGEKEYMDGERYSDDWEQPAKQRIAYDGKVQWSTELYEGQVGLQGGIGELNAMAFTVPMTPKALLGQSVRQDVRKTLAEVLREAGEVIVRPQTEAVDGRDCVVLEAFGVGKEDNPHNVLVWIDEQRDYRPLKIEIYRAPGRDDEWPGQGKWDALWKRVANIKLERIDGVWFPVRGDRYFFEQETLGPDGMSKEEFRKAFGHLSKEEALKKLRHVTLPKYHRRIELTNVRINRGIPDEKFRIDFPKGCEVWDGMKRERYIVGEASERYAQMSDAEIIAEVGRMDMDGLVETIGHIVDRRGEVTNKRLVYAAVKRLVEMGRPAVERLSAEIRTTEEARRQSIMAFVLRAIGDADAVEALIDALERCGFSSDYGLGEVNGPLAEFMHTNQMDPARAGLHLGRPVREITIALEKLTGHTEGHDHFNAYDANGERLGSYTITPEIRERQRAHRKEVAERWRQWRRHR